MHGWLVGKAGTPRGETAMTSVVDSLLKHVEIHCLEYFRPLSSRDTLYFRSLPCIHHLANLKLATLAS